MAVILFTRIILAGELFFPTQVFQIIDDIDFFNLESFSSNYVHFFLYLNFF
jgi:hypothetical protein